MLLLLVACIGSAALGELIDSVAIGAIVVMNGLFGFYQEYGAQNAVLAMRAMTAPRARVLRDGEAVMRPSAEIVLGDILLLAAGDVVAADARLVEAHDLSTGEAPLTGESLPMAKSTDPVPADAPLAERHDQVFLGTAVTAGTGVALVTATGMDTELGRIASLLAGTKSGTTPLQDQLARVGHRLLMLCLGIVAVVGAVGLAQGHPWLDVLMLAVALAVAAVPEGLPAIVTIALSVGVRRMAAHHVLVRKLASVETLGSATVLCTDKTGTLTTGVMAVREAWGPDRHATLHAGAACVDAELQAEGRASGDPTEVAILRAAAELGIQRSEIEQSNPRVSERPFDPTRKRMSILRSDGRLYVKGAPDLLLPLCTAGTAGAEAANMEIAARGLRVLGVALGEGREEEGLTLLGLLGLQDPPRPEAIAAIAAARRAGITTVMITGDHPLTAVAIARELGLLSADEDPAERVHARVTPEDKLDIVRAWKARGAVVAMTGDGVNDAPALREAHIGIAMGQTGTEVTREAAEMILADDNFASIVEAVRQGRGIWDNIQGTIVYLLTGNFGELAVVLGASLLGLPVPLLPLQLLWINLATDGLPALALVTDPPADDLLERPPRPPGSAMLDRSAWLRIASVGLLEASIVLGVFAWSLRHGDVDRARSMAFSTIVFAELLRAFGARSVRQTHFEVGAFTNPRLLVVIFLSALIQFGMQQIPAVQRLFHLSPLSLLEGAATLGLGLIPVTVVELSKIARRSWSRR